LRSSGFCQWCLAASTLALAAAGNGHGDRCRTARGQIGAEDFPNQLLVLLAFLDADFPGCNPYGGCMQASELWQDSENGVRVRSGGAYLAAGILRL